MDVPNEFMAECLKDIDGASYCTECGKAYTLSDAGFFKTQCNCLKLMLVKASWKMREPFQEALDDYQCGTPFVLHRKVSVDEVREIRKEEYRRNIESMMAEA